MGYGLPAAIGSKLARPDVPVVCLAGDGGYMMTFQELETAVRLGTPVISIVTDNTVSQPTLLRDPTDAIRTEVVANPAPGQLPDNLPQVATAPGEVTVANGR